MILDEEYDFEKGRDIKVGEKLLFLDAFLVEEDIDKPYSWQVKFQSQDGYIGEANQTYFVTEDEWKEIKSFCEIQASLKDKAILNSVLSAAIEVLVTYCPQIDCPTLNTIVNALNTSNEKNASIVSDIRKHLISTITDAN